MKPNQIYSVLNDINHQMYGADALDVNDLQGLVSMGKSIIDAEQTDVFLGKLVDRIGKTIIRTLDLELDFPGLLMDSFSFGSILQKININPFDTIRNASYDIGSADFQPTLLDVHKPSIFVKYFQDGIDTWKFQVTITEDQMFSAFASESAMSQFFDAIINAMTESMIYCVNNMSRTAVNNFIAEKIKASNGVINLLSGYNTLNSTSLTPEAAMRSRDFLRYAVNEIRKYIKYLAQPSVLYNVGDGSGNPVVRTTTRDNAHIFALTEFVAGIEAYLENGDQVMHNEFLNIPGYTEVAYWQSNKGDSTTNDFATVSSIAVTPSSEEGQDNPQDVEQSGIVCVIADRQAIAVGINKRHSGAFYNPIDHYTNLASDATIQFINDLSESGLVFLVAGTEGNLEDLTVKAASGTYYDHATSEYQSGITVKGGKITGTLKFVEGGLAASGPLAGDGYFLALSLYDSHAEIEAMGDVKVGLKPSAGTGLVSIKGDADDVIVMKVTDINDQKFEVVSTKTGYNKNIQSYDLSKLKLTK